MFIAKRLSLLSLALLLVCLCTALAQAKPAKEVQEKRQYEVAPGGPYSIAVLDFDTNGQSYSYQGSSLNADSAIPAILTTELANSPRFTVVEREQLEAVLKEQNLGASGVISPETAASLGEVLGVDYLVIGKITELHIEEGKSSGVSIGFINTSSKAANKAKVSIELKVIDTESARIVAAVGCRKTFIIGNGSGSTHVFGIGGSSGKDKSDKSGMTDTYYAIAEELAASLNTVTFKKLPPKVNYKGIIAVVDGENIYINLGKTQGIKKSMVFKVYREMVKAGTTIKLNLAEIQAVSVDETSTQCKILNKTKELKAGDLFESKF